MRKAPHTEIWAPLHHMLSLFLYNDKKGLHSVPDNVMAPEISVACRKKGEKSIYDMNEDLKWPFKKGPRSTFTLNSEITWKMSRCKRVWRIATFYQALFYMQYHCHLGHALLQGHIIVPSNRAQSNFTYCLICSSNEPCHLYPEYIFSSNEPCHLYPECIFCTRHLQVI